jgi:hypothetical protein
VGPRTGLDDVERRKFLTVPLSSSPYPVTIPTELPRLPLTGASLKLSAEARFDLSVWVGCSFCHGLCTRNI